MAERGSPLLGVCRRVEATGHPGHERTRGRGAGHQHANFLRGCNYHVNGRRIRIGRDLTTCRSRTATRQVHEVVIAIRALLHLGPKLHACNRIGWVTRRVTVFARTESRDQHQGEQGRERTTRSHPSHGRKRRASSDGRPMPGAEPATWVRSPWPLRAIFEVEPVYSRPCRLRYN